MVEIILHFHYISILEFQISVTRQGGEMANTVIDRKASRECNAFFQFFFFLEDFACLFGEQLISKGAEISH